MNSKLVFGQYYNTSSWIHRLDPRTKLVCLFVLMIALFLITDILILLATLAVVLVVVLSSKVPLSKFFQGIKMMAMLLIFTFFFQIAFNTSGNLLRTFTFNMTIINLSIIIGLLILFVVMGKFIKKFRITTFILFFFIVMYIQYKFDISKLLFTYNINIYDAGIESAFKILVRIISLISLSSLLTLTTTPTDLNNGLESVAKPLKYLRVNVSVLSMMISIALRFIPTLINEANRILKAQASRGVDFKEGKLREKITQIVSLLIPMFVIAYKRAEELANAMEARGYIPGANRSKLNELNYHTADIIAYVATFAILIALLVVKIGI